MSRISEGLQNEFHEPEVTAPSVIPDLLRRARNERMLKRYESFTPSRCTILVLEENRQRQEELCELLRSVGLMPVAATTATEALETMVRRFVDLVVCGPSLPDMSGFEFTKELKSLRCVPAHEPISVILLASSDSNSAQEALRSGADLVCLAERTATMLLPQVLFLLR
jgi:CheY-like chemotaxis protein